MRNDNAVRFVPVPSERRAAKSRAAVRVTSFTGAWCLALLLVATAAPAQVFVAPRRAQKSQVRYFRFDWKHVDILVGSEADTRRAAQLGPTSDVPLAADGGTPRDHLGEMLNAHSDIRIVSDGGVTYLPPAAPAQSKLSPYATALAPETGGIRLYFYESERAVAERAVPLITNAYRDLVDDFHYVPTETFPYILYSSYQEFLQTNLFPLQEGVLGVTSPTDLKLTLPYLGDHRLFAEVSKHEMAHQFTIQKLRSIAKAGDLFGEPMDEIPLWFVEGLAEFYAHGGVNPEAEMAVRDLLINPDLMNGYALIGFYEDRPGSVLWTYQVGQVRCAFFEQTYGKGFIQKVLEASPLMVGSFRQQATVKGFPQLIQRLTGDDEKTVNRKFETWLKRHAFKDYLDSEQDAPSVRPLLEDIQGIANALATSADGNLVLYRAIDPDSGQSRLYLFDRRDPTRQVMVAMDGVPGQESLHPVASRNFDVRPDALVFVAESGAHDVLYWQEVRVDVTRRETPPGLPAPGMVPPPTPWSAFISLRKQRRFDLGKQGLLAVSSPAFSPDGKHVAFIGLSNGGQRDVYRLDLSSEDAAPRVQRLTQDSYSERQLSWGPQGIVFSSDATSHGYYNLFVVSDVAPFDIQRLTTEARDHNGPKALGNGKVYFTAYDQTRSDVYEISGDKIVRRTEITTGFFDVAAGPGESLIALFHHAGQRRPVVIPAYALRPRGATVQPEGEGPLGRSVRPLEGATPYNWFRLQNLELGSLFGIIAGSSYGIAGQIFGSVTDRLRNHVLLLNAAAYGSFEQSDALLAYINQEQRLTWAAGLFQSLYYRADRTFENLFGTFTSAQRYFGLMGRVRYPFNMFVFLETDLSIGGATYFLLNRTKAELTDPLITGTSDDLLGSWEAANGGLRFQTEASVRLGYDTIRYYRGTGGIAGHSFLLEGTLTAQPKDRQVFGALRLDAEQLFPISGRTHVFLRGGVGSTFGGRFAREFYLSSFDTLRGVPFGDPNWLLGRNYAFSTLELQFPLTAIIQLIFLSDIEGVVGVDFGGVGNRFVDIWDHRVLDLVVGVNLGLGPFLLRLHFARPFDTGSPFGTPVRPGEWVTNFSLGLLGWDVGLTSRQSHRPNVRASPLMTGKSFDATR